MLLAGYQPEGKGVGNRKIQHAVHVLIGLGGEFRVAPRRADFRREAGKIRSMRYDSDCASFRTRTIKRSLRPAQNLDSFNVLQDHREEYRRLSEIGGD